MDKYKNILFENPRPFIIAQLENDRLIINETNINHEKNIDINLGDIKENREIKGLVKSTLEKKADNITINNIKNKFNLKSKKISKNEVIVWFDIEDNLYDLSKANFLSNLTHEFKTPLNLIFSSVQLLNKKIECNKEFSYDDMEKYLKIINQNSYRILKLVNNISDDNRIDLGHSNYSPTNANIIYFIEDICESIEPFVKSNNMNIVFDTDIEELIISFDMEKMERIILNLISNAVKFRKENKGKIIISITHNDEFVNISVKDNGIGMSEEFQKRVFKSFEREKTSTTSGIQGTGLGLAIAKNLALLMRGDLTCTSKIGQGTEFIFTFSARIAKGGSKLIEQAKVREVVLKGKRILVVEDNDLNREITAEILGAEGCFIEEAENGKIALEKVRTSKVGYYDLVLMDIQMPIMDGYEAVKHIRALENEALASVPIIAMTANAFEEDKRKAMETGMDAYVSKPIDIDKMLGTLMEILKNEE